MPPTPAGDRPAAATIHLGRSGAASCRTGFEATFGKAADWVRRNRSRHHLWQYLLSCDHEIAPADARLHRRARRQSDLADTALPDWAGAPLREYPSCSRVQFIVALLRCAPLVISWPASLSDLAQDQCDLAGTEDQQTIRLLEIGGSQRVGIAAAAGIGFTCDIMDRTARCVEGRKALRFG